MGSLKFLLKAKGKDLDDSTLALAKKAAEIGFEKDHDPGKNFGNKQGRVSCDLPFDASQPYMKNATQKSLGKRLYWQGNKKTEVNWGLSNDTEVAKSCWAALDVCFKDKEDWPCVQAVILAISLEKHKLAVNARAVKHQVKLTPHQVEMAIAIRAYTAERQAMIPGYEFRWLYKYMNEQLRYANGELSGAPPGEDQKTGAAKLTELKQYILLLSNALKDKALTVALGDKDAQQKEHLYRAVSFKVDPKWKTGYKMTLYPFISTARVKAKTDPFIANDGQLWVLDNVKGSGAVDLWGVFGADETEELVQMMTDVEITDVMKDQVMKDEKRGDIKYTLVKMKATNDPLADFKSPVGSSQEKQKDPKGGSSQATTSSPEKQKDPKAGLSQEKHKDPNAAAMS